jgi:hypothetical protein
MAGIQLILSRELPRTTEQISAIVIITNSNFMSLSKGAAERNDAEQIHKYDFLVNFALPYFHHRVSCFTEG